MHIKPQHIFIKDYNYLLPGEKIAAYPLEKRDSSKLLIYENGTLTDDVFFHLPNHLPSNSLLVLNDTRVIEARIFFQKPTGGVIEIFCLEPHRATIEHALNETKKITWKCLIGGASKWKAGQILEKQITAGYKPVALHAKYTGKEADSFIIEFEWDQGISFAEVLHAAGAIPLPPYIKRNAEETDKERYQTIFSAHEGSVAAPTAALHFTENVFEELEKKGIEKTFLTLHVGAGTFKPVKSETIAAHQMHYETFTVSLSSLKKIAEQKKIIAVGTTSVRTLESLHWLSLKHKRNGNTDWELSQWECYELDQQTGYQESYRYLINWMENNNVDHLHCRTSLIIVPGYDFKVADGLITNFHQPQSTLLLLVAAFVGDDLPGGQANWQKIYDHALQNDYRFLSYGDSSLLWKGASLNSDKGGT